MDANPSIYNRNHISNFQLIRSVSHSSPPFVSPQLNQVRLFRTFVQRLYAPYRAIPYRLDDVPSTKAQPGNDWHAFRPQCQFFDDVHTREFRHIQVVYRSRIQAPRLLIGIHVLPLSFIFIFLIYVNSLYDCCVYYSFMHSLSV